MNRRAALVWALGAMVASAKGGLAGLPAVRRHSALPAALDDLYDERFVGALPQISLEDVAARLVARGVLVGATSEGWLSERPRWRFDLGRVGADAADDALIEFDHSFYTETELLLYAFVARLRSEAASGRHPLAPGDAAGGRVSWSREVVEGRWDA